MGTIDLPLRDGRNLRVHDSGGDGFPLVWHHGTPQSGRLLPPVVEAAAARGFRVVSYGRPGYGGSTPQVGRTVGSAAEDVRQLTDALDLPRFAVMGASGGGPHTLACAAKLPDRVTAAVCLAGLAPFSEDYDWYGGMVDDSSLRAARKGRETRLQHGETQEFDPTSFTDADWAALRGTWGPLGQDAGAAGDVAAEADDDLAYVTPWGFSVADVRVPVLLVHGGEDQIVPFGHSEWLLRNLPDAELWSRPRDGHISVLNALPTALDWLRNLVVR
ncbi:alpha/beta fold hydrolase [Amycolatopsis circi]|uniref:alpha/beta fold hydrolase n=1 Tax=Amycolatopsis circi TaxID=871959 RepID=UPI000E25BD28|nr:alpha/beta hydrolase [Amycolatopsis circi]